MSYNGNGSIVSAAIVASGFLAGVASVAQMVMQPRAEPTIARIRPFVAPMAQAAWQCVREPRVPLQAHEDNDERR